MNGERLKETPSQTAGPYLHIGMAPGVAGLKVRECETAWHTGLRGDPIMIEGTIRDGAGELVTDALVEIWQAGANGEFDAENHRGFARAAVDPDTGKFRFETVKPGRFKDRVGRLQAPHVSLLIFARGINLHLHTRIYFGDERDANDGDPVLGMIRDRAARQTLIATPDSQANVPTYIFDIALQGDGETVFFDI